jgi:hypothetical protein
MTLEDFTSYTEVDPNSHITKTANHIDAKLYRNEDAYVYKDNGVNHFGSSFTHLIGTKPVAHYDNGECGIWAVAQGIGSIDSADAGNELTVYWYYHNTYHYVLYIHERYNSVSYETRTGVVDQFVAGTWYYLKIVKSGTSFTLYIYSDSARTNLITSISLTLHADISYQYCYGCLSWNSGNAYWLQAYIDNLDLQEGGAILKEVADSLSLSDSLLCNKTFTVTDSIGLADTPLKDWTPQITDAVALSDTVLRDKTFTISDSISLTDAVYKILTQYITDQISLADTIQTDKQLLITDAVALSDAVEVIGGAIIKYVTDVIGLSDLVSTPQKAVIIQDLINLLDQITVTGPAVPTPLGGGRVITWTPIRIKEELTPEEKPKLEVIPQPLPAGMTFEELVAYAHNMLQPLKVTEEELKRILQPVLQLLPKNERQKEELQALRELLASLKFERESVEDSLRKILQNVKEKN